MAHWLMPRWDYVQIGGSPAIAAHVGKFMGIRNGIDIDIWDPENDDLLPRPYNADSVVGNPNPQCPGPRNLNPHQLCE